MDEEILDETEVALMSGSKLDANLSRQLAKSHEALRDKHELIQRELELSEECINDLRIENEFLRKLLRKIIEADFDLRHTIEDASKVL